MGNEKPLTRDALVGMQVIDSKGVLIGKVKDVAFAVGKTGISLTVENQDGEVQNVGWDEIQGAADFIIIKPAQAQQNTYQPQAYHAMPQQQQAAAQSTTTQPMCPTCGRPLTWIPQYQRWYCYNDKKYV